MFLPRHFVAESPTPVGLFALSNSILLSPALLENVVVPEAALLGDPREQFPSLSPACSWPPLEF